MKVFKLTACAAAVAQAVICAPAFAADSISGALSEGTAKLNLRYRTELVENDNPAQDDATANTLRTRLTWKSADYNNLSVLLEFDNVSHLFKEDFDDGVNGKGEYAAILDPDGTDLNQSVLTWKASDSLSLLGGRQRINLDDQRFVGGVGWRQNEQTFDAYGAKYSAGGFEAFYAYVDNVNRIVGPVSGGADWNSDSHFVNVSYTLSPMFKATGFGYFLDFGAAGENKASPDNSTDTTGVRISGSFADAPLKPGYILSFATQSEAGDSTLDYDADYTLAELNATIAGLKIELGQEVAGSDEDANIGFKFPLATGHKFFGFADLFLGTPGAGLEDTYVKASYTLAGYKLSAHYHEFESDVGSSSYGDELDLVVAKKINDNYSALLKFADYSADEFGVDTQKIWIMLTAAF